MNRCTNGSSTLMKSKGKMSSLLEKNSIDFDSSPCQVPLNLLKVEIAHGSDRHLIELNMEEDIRVCHLQNEIAQRTGVHPCNQRIYFRGQHLEHCPQSRLVDFHVFNNSSLTLVGYPPEKHNPMCQQCDMCSKRVGCHQNQCPQIPQYRSC